MLYNILSFFFKIASMLGAILLSYTRRTMLPVIFYGLNVFLAPENIEIDTKIINCELTVTDLWPFEGFGGHLGRHLEKKTSEAPILVNF